MDIKSPEERSRNMAAIRSKNTKLECISENCFLHRDTDTVLILVKYSDTRTFICVNIILLFLFTDVSGTDFLVVNMRICQNQ